MVARYQIGRTCGEIVMAFVMAIVHVAIVAYACFILTPLFILRGLDWCVGAPIARLIRFGLRRAGHAPRVPRDSYLGAAIAEAKQVRAENPEWFDGHPGFERRALNWGALGQFVTAIATLVLIRLGLSFIGY